MSIKTDHLGRKRDHLLGHHNRERRQRGLRELKDGSNGLDDAAQYHAEDMARESYLAHNSHDPFRLWYERIARFIRYDGRIGAENIASGYKYSRDVVDAWMASPGHRANILNPDLERVSFGYARNTSTGERYWVADFLY